MLKTLELLSRNKAVQSYKVLDFKQGQDFYFLKCTATLRDGTELHIREFISVTEIAYAFHWQETQGKLICRWDNAPHHPEIKTYPHHKHEPELRESSIMDIEDVLKEIEKNLSL